MTARLWSLDRKQQPIEIAGHDGPVVAVALDDRGNLALTGSADGNARAWQLDPASDPLVLGGHRESVVAVGLKSHDQRVLTASLDGTLREWLLDDAQLAQTLWKSPRDCLPRQSREALLNETPSDAETGFRACERQFGSER